MIFKTYYPLISISIFSLFIIIAHISASNEYSVVKNTISDLGAQGYDKKIIMQAGFLLFGLTLSAGILLNGLNFNNVLILVYAFCVALTGIFCTQPFVLSETINYSQAHSYLHSVFAQIAGIAFSLGILIQMFSEKNESTKWVHLLFFVLIIVCSLSFGLFKNHQGIAQRILYLISFFWLAKYFHS